MIAVVSLFFNLPNGRGYQCKGLITGLYCSLRSLCFYSVVSGIQKNYSARSGNVNRRQPKIMVNAAMGPLLSLSLFFIPLLLLLHLPMCYPTRNMFHRQSYLV